MNKRGVLSLLPTIAAAFVMLAAVGNVQASGEKGNGGQKFGSGKKGGRFQRIEFNTSGRHDGSHAGYYDPKTHAHALRRLKLESRRTPIVKLCGGSHKPASALVDVAGHLQHSAHTSVVESPSVLSKRERLVAAALFKSVRGSLLGIQYVPIFRNNTVISLRFNKERVRLDQLVHQFRVRKNGSIVMEIRRVLENGELSPKLMSKSAYDPATGDVAHMTYTSSKEGMKEYKRALLKAEPGLQPGPDLAKALDNMVPRSVAKASGEIK